MREVGVDLSTATPMLLDDALARQAQILVTMGCGEQCPVVPGAKRIDWNVPDPKGRDAQEVRVIRDNIKRQVVALIEQERLQ